MSNKFKRVIVCRSANESLAPGATVGYECSICKEPLQITPSGRTTLEGDSTSELLCNDCGLLYVNIAESAGRLAWTEVGPAAKEQLSAGNNSPLADFMRRRHEH